MPSRKSVGNTYTDLGHSSMRRLSSIASLHQLLPFSRNRRSDHGSDNTSSPSEMSSSVFTTSTSTVSSLAQLVKDTDDTKSSPGEAMPSKTKEVLHRGATTSMPRSRTFSSLPLPMRSKKQKSPRVEQPSLIGPDPDRRPIPTGSTKSYLPFGHRSDRQAHSASTQPRLNRSDTEPLLPAVLDQVNIVHRSTTFKENLAPSSIKSLELKGPQPGSSDSSKLLACQQSHGSNDPDVLDDGKTSCKAVLKTPTKSWAKPVEDVGDDKTPTQKSYLAATAPVARYRRALTDISNIYQASMEEEEVVTSPRSQRYVLEAQPMAYWSGRLSSVLDRDQSQELTANFGSPGTMARRSETDKLFASAAKTARTRRAFEELYALCATDQAKESFVKFQLQYAAIHNESELAKPVGPRSSRAKAYLTASGKDGKALPENTLPPSTDSGRKPSFVDRLLGRNKRNSLA